MKTVYELRDEYLKAVDENIVNYDEAWRAFLADCAFPAAAEPDPEQSDADYHGACERFTPRA